MEKVREDIAKMCGIQGSLYPYLSAFGWVLKTDMSSSAKPNFHNFVNATACLLEYQRGRNSMHMPEGDISFLVNAAYAAFYRFGDMKDIQLELERSSRIQEICIVICVYNRAHTINL